MNSAFLEGVEHFEKRRWDAALKCFDRIANGSQDPQVLNYRGRVLAELDRLPEALACIEACVKLQPQNAADLRNKGVLLSRMRRPAEALEAFQAARKLNPANVEIGTKVAVLLHQLEQREEALRAIEPIVQMAPTDLNALNTRGMILDSFCRYEDALRDFEQVLKIDPQFADGINNRGMIHARFGQLPEALACYEKSLALLGDQPQARYNRAMVLLAMGQWEAGFREFEVRWQISQLEAARFDRLGARWLGKEDLTGKTIILHHEQGYGDTLQFCRYSQLVMQKGAKVILAVPRGLHRLMQSLPGQPMVISEGQSIPPHDFYTPLMSLPLAFGTSLSSLPSSIPYLWAEREKSQLWEKRLGPRRRPRIGIAWSGRRYPPINFPRDIELAKLRPFFSLSADFFCIQKDIDEAERNQLRALGVPIWAPDDIDDFADTAALISCLDLVITVDTSVAHLAGALGKPVWLMNRFASCWRWLQDGRQFTSWYPNMRLFRQVAPGDWDAVVRDIQGELQRFIGRSSRHGASEVRPAEAAPKSEIAIKVMERALAVHGAGEFQEAIGLYRKVLELAPESADAVHYLGVALTQSRQLEEGLQNLTKAVEMQPDSAAAHNHLGNCLHELKRDEDALKSYDAAILLDRGFADPHYNRGIALAALRRWELAIASYEASLVLKPAHGEAHNNLGIACLELKRFEEALVHFKRALEFAPTLVGAFVNQSGAMRQLGLFDEALDSCDRALEISATNAEVHSSRGAVLAALGRDVEALASYDRAIELDLANSEAYASRGTVLVTLGRDGEALENYNRAIAINPHLPVGLWNKALLQLANGRFDEGWPLYEARWNVAALGKKHRCGDQPPWLGGDDISGKTILLHAEQGYGDTLQFCRYTTKVKALGAHVILGVPEGLRMLMQSLDGVDQVIGDGPLPKYDVHCPLLSLPFAFGTTEQSIPASIPYLCADKAKAEAWRGRLGKGKGPKIGLAWFGQTTHTNDRNRSLPLAQLKPLFDDPYMFFSLQQDTRPTDKPALEELKNLVHFGREALIDFSETAALISNLDLVISVDTAVAHLAGALGKPVLLLVPYVSDWRWMRHRSDTPWYPTATLLRQERLGDWGPVVEQTKRHLVSQLAPTSHKRGGKVSVD